MPIRTILLIIIIQISLVSIARDIVPSKSYAIKEPLKSYLLAIDKKGNLLVAVGEHGIILHSKDNGQNWNQIISPTRSTLTDVVITKNNSIFIVGHDEIILKAKSIDDKYIITNYNPQNNNALFAIEQLDQNNLIAIGTYGTIVTSNNRGRTWKKIIIDNKFDYHLYDAIFSKTSNKLVICGENNSLYISPFPQLSFQKVDIPKNNKSLFTLLKDNHNNIYAAGIEGYIIYSNNKLTNWEFLKNSSSNSIYASAIVNNRPYWGGANGNLFDINQKRINQNKTFQISDFVQLSENKIIAVGNIGIKTIELKI